MQAKGLARGLQRRVGRGIDLAARCLALAGGGALIAITAMTVVSIAGRELADIDVFPLNRLGPVQGDFELVEMACAFAIFAFLPWCQMRRGHVTVDIFVQPLGPRVAAGLSLVGNLLLTACAVLIAWKLGEGMLDKRSYTETTLILRVPVWWGYAAALVGAWLFALTGGFTVWRSLNEMLGDGEPR